MKLDGTECLGGSVLKLCVCYSIDELLNQNQDIPVQESQIKTRKNTLKSDVLWTLDYSLTMEYPKDRLSSQPFKATNNKSILVSCCFFSVFCSKNWFEIVFQKPRTLDSSILDKSLLQK